MRPKNGNYRLDVTDFGPVAKASVEFRPLTVFVGPSNTGKSYLAMLVYALHQGLGDAVRVGGDRWLHMTPWFSLLARSENDAFLADLRKWLESSGESRAGHLVPKIVPLLQRASGVSFVAELQRCFGIDNLAALSRAGIAKARSVVRIGASDESDDGLAYELAFGPLRVRLAAIVGEAFAPSYLGGLRGPLVRHVRDGRVDDDEFRSVVATTLESEARRRLGAAGQRAYYLPADRTGVMHSHQVVVGTLVQSATTAGLRPSTNVPMLSGVLADFLNQLIELGGALPRRRRKAELDSPFEANLLQGSVHLRREASYPSFTYRPQGWPDDLPLMRVSSMVSELAPVVLYLRYVVEPGDVVIIEEPEAHLHPAMQTKLARELVRLVRSGVRIVLTTHSEWLLEQIGNLVALSGLPAADRANIAEEDVSLPPEDVGAWFFKPCKRPRGSVVEEVKLNPQTGTFPTDYDDVARALYDEGARIFNRGQALREAGE